MNLTSCPPRKEEASTPSWLGTAQPLSLALSILREQQAQQDCVDKSRVGQAGQSCFLQLPMRTMIGSAGVKRLWVDFPFSNVPS